MYLTRRGKFVVLSIIAVIALLVMGWFIQSSPYFSRAASGEATITYQPPNADVDGTFGVIMRISAPTETKITGLTMVFDNSGPVSINSAGGPVVLGSKADMFSEVVDEDNRFTYVTTKADSELSNMVVVPINVICSATGQGAIKVNSALSQVVVSGSNTALSVKQLEDTSFNCTSADIGGGGGPTGADVSATFEPSSATYPINAVRQATLSIKPKDGATKLSAWDVTFDLGEKVQYADSPRRGMSEGETSQTTATGPGSAIVPGAGGAGGPGTAVGVTPPAGKTGPTTAPIIPPDVEIPPIGEEPEAPDRISPPETNPLPQGCQEIVRSIGSDKRTVRIAVTCVGSELPTMANIRIPVRGVSIGTGKISIKDIQVVGPQSNTEYSVTKGEQAYTVSEGGGDGGTGNVTLNLAVKLQGITTKPKNDKPMSMTVGLRNLSMQGPQYRKATFTVDGSGVWRGSVKFDVSPGSGYALSIKGSHHVQKKICDSSPKETFPGTYDCARGNLTISDGEQAVDATGIIVLVGDLPQQDGIVNSYDISLVRNLLGKADETSVSQADLNRDGAVNQIDYSLVIAALSVRNDQPL